MIFAALPFLSAFIGSANTAALTERGDILLDPSLLIPGRSTCNLLLPLDPFAPTSCHNTTVQKDLCCFEAPGGHLLQTQFWDYESPLDWAGPTDSWTMHGMYQRSLCSCVSKFNYFVFNRSLARPL